MSVSLEKNENEVDFPTLARVLAGAREIRKVQHAH